MKVAHEMWKHVLLLIDDLEFRIET